MEALEIRWIQGFANKTIEFADDKTICYACGNHLCFLNLETRTQSVFLSPGRGIGALTASRNSGIFAFSEEKLNPSIFVYTFPGLQLKNELKGVAKLGYTSLALSDAAPYLGSCSTLPDHSITVWNWENAEQLYTQPEAGKYVVSLAFNPMNWLQLCALGTTSLTVWNVEKCGRLHVLTPSKIELPAVYGRFAKSQAWSSLPVRSRLKAKLEARVRLTPSAICWTVTSKLYVGCAEGYLLLVDPESRSVSVLFNPEADDAIPELRRNSFQGLALNKNGLIAVGKESTAHCLQIKGTQIKITQTWQLERPATTVMCSPDSKTLLLSSKTGQIYVLNPAQSDKTVKVLDVLSGNFVAGALLNNDKNICVSLRESGALQLWSSDGICLSSLPLQTEVTCLACCPIANYAAVGTATGSVLFIDLNQEQRPRLVHQVSLYHTAVAHLIFDHDGCYLFTSGSDSHVYVLDAKPSKMFSVIGYTVVPGHILALSTQCIRDRSEVKVLALCAGEEDTKEDGSLLTVLSLSAQNLAGADSADRDGCLSSQVLKAFRFRVPRPLTSCVLGVGEVFAYCLRNKTFQRFVLPEDTGDLSNQQVVGLKPAQQVKGHPAGPAFLALSPHSLWLASVGRDGLLQIRETASMERYIELWCHSCRLYGAKRVSFSTDSCTLLTAGLKDGSLVCTNIRVKGGDGSKMNEAIRYSKTVAHFLKNVFDAENPILINFPVLSRRSAAGTENAEESEASGGASVDVTGQDESDNSLLCAPPSQPTWLESRREAVIKEDNEKYAETKKYLRETIKELRESIQEIIRDSENEPEQFYTLNVEEEQRLEATVEEEVARVRSEIEWDIIQKRYLADALKREFWDTMEVIGKNIKAFHSDLEVPNYPVKKRTEKELEDLSRVENLRKIEIAACSLSSPSAQEEEQEEKVQEAESAALTGSISAQLGYSNPYGYNQFSVRTVEQRINQIILLQDVIYRIKMGFNADFEALHKQKVQALTRVRERNKRIREIMLQLDLHEEIWEPSLTNSECPERVLIVEDSEIKAERYITAEQQEEERRKLEEERHLAAQADDSRETPLVALMNGVLKGEKKDSLNKEIPPPEFVLTKPDIQWSEEEKKVFREYEKKAKELSEEKENYKKLLKHELKTLHQLNKEETERFDENLPKLLEKKMNCTAAIYQEELKITCLVDAVLREEMIRFEEQEVRVELEKMLASKDETGEKLKSHEEEVKLFQEAYDSLVLEDKLLDKEFKKEFVDVPRHLVDQLYYLFKCRPRAQKMRTQTAPDALSKMLRAMEELDDPKNMPKGLRPAAWNKFCLVRRRKVESEQKMKEKALTLAEMEAFLQKRRDEDKAAQEEVKKLSEELESLHRERNRLLMDTVVQVILKKGQVEVSTTDLTAYSPDGDFILCHRRVVDDLRSTIRTLEEENRASMEEYNNIQKDIIQVKREQKVMRKKIQDLKAEERRLEMIRPSKHGSQLDAGCHTLKQISSLERIIDFMDKNHEKNVQQRLNKIEQIKKKTAAKQRQNAALQQQLRELQVTVSELRHVVAATVPSEEEEKARQEERYQQILKTCQLQRLTKAQSERLTVLRAEVDCLKKGMFPSFD